MATHSSVLAWRIPGTGEPVGLPSMGSHRVGHDWSDLAAVAAAGLLFLRNSLAAVPRAPSLFFFKLFMYIWLHWVLVVANGFIGCLRAWGLRCPEACGILIPRPGMEPVSPALEGGALTTGPPEKSPRAPSLHDSTEGFDVLTFDTVDHIPAYFKYSLLLASVRACLGFPLPIWLLFVCFGWVFSFLWLMLKVS